MIIFNSNYSAVYFLRFFFPLVRRTFHFVRTSSSPNCNHQCCVYIPVYSFCSRTIQASNTKTWVRLRYRGPCFYQPTDVIRRSRGQWSAHVARTQPASGKDGWRCYASLDDWRGKMAAPEEPELSQAQTEKLLQFQVDSLNSTITFVRLIHMLIHKCWCRLTVNRGNRPCLDAFCTGNLTLPASPPSVSRQLEPQLTLAKLADIS